MENDSVPPRHPDSPDHADRPENRAAPLLRRTPSVAPDSSTPRGIQQPRALGPALVLLVGLTACGLSREERQSDSAAAAPSHSNVLRLATTTSTADTGLLEFLLPDFEESHKVRVDVIAVGSGQALKLGEQGDVDVLLVHAPRSEQKFLEAGHAIRRDDVMYNSFLLLGPEADPARIRGQGIVEALKNIASSQEQFVSRGDDSGTHKRELELWKSAGGLAAWDNYVETGRGMGHTLVTANELAAHVLCDRGTYLKLRDKISLVPLVQGEPVLHNPYGVLVVNPDKHDRVNSELATRLADYLVSDPVQHKIASFRLHDEVLFHPHTRDTH